MKKPVALTVAVLAVGSLGLAAVVPQDAGQEGGSVSATVQPTPAALDFTMKSIEGKEINLAEKYRGKVVLMVNVASLCGYTPQYKGLEKLHEEYSKRGLAVLGFPANNFGGQEPGTNEEILEFCQDRFDVQFPMFAKVSVKGEDICPLYELLTDREKTPVSEGDIKWNFEKFLLDRDGKVVKHYRSNVTPEDVAKDIEPLLGKT